MTAGIYYRPNPGSGNILSIYIVDENGNYVDGCHERQIHRSKIKKIIKDFIKSYRCKIITNNEELNIIKIVIELGYQDFLIEEPKFVSKKQNTYGLYTNTRKIIDLLRLFSRGENISTDDLTPREKAKGLALMAQKQADPKSDFVLYVDPHRKPGEDSLGDIFVYKIIGTPKTAEIDDTWKDSAEEYLREKAQVITNKWLDDMEKDGIEVRNRELKLKVQSIIKTAQSEIFEYETKLSPAMGYTKDAIIQVYKNAFIKLLEI